MFNKINKIIQCIQPMTNCTASVVEYAYDYIKLSLKFENSRESEVFLKAARESGLDDFLHHANQPIVVIKLAFNTREVLNGSILGTTNLLSSAFGKADIPFSVPLTKQAMRNALITAGYVDFSIHLDCVKSALPALNLTAEESDAFDKIIDILDDYYELSDYRGYLLSDLPIPNFDIPNYNEQDRSNLRSPLYQQFVSLTELISKIKDPNVIETVGSFMGDIHHILVCTTHGGLLPSPRDMLKTIQRMLVCGKNNHEYLKNLTNKAIDVSWCFKHLSTELAAKGHIVTNDYIIIDLQSQQQLEMTYVKKDDFEIPDYINVKIINVYNTKSREMGELREDLFFTLLGLENMAENLRYDANGRLID